jgi:hypothetical protein
MSGTTVSRSATIGAALAVPFAFLITLLLLRIEPPLGAMLRGDPDQPNVVGTGLVLASLVLSIVGLVLAVTPLVRASRAGATLSSARGDLIVAAFILLFVGLFVGGFIVDQLPCWRGVPNCD